MAAERAVISISQQAREQSKERLETVARGLTCFVIMPFGEKDERELGAAVASGATEMPLERVNFDAVYRHLIKPTIEGAGFEVHRSDEIPDPGSIHQEMLRRIIDSDLAVVVVAAWNPNVMYELGVRHTARKNGTVMLMRSAEQLPFNIAGMRAVQYPAFREEMEWEQKVESVRDAQDRLRDAIISTLNPTAPDSPVHTLVPGLNVSRPSRTLKYRIGHKCKLNKFILHNFDINRSGFHGAEPVSDRQEICKAAKNKRIGVIEGDLTLIDCVDAWVNPENTRFEMARSHDHSVSAIIRSHAAGGGRLDMPPASDRVARKLRRAALAAGGQVEAAAAIALPPQNLRNSNKLRAIVHVAAQNGTRGRGYQTIRNVDDCIVNSLSAIVRYNKRRIFSPPIRSVLIPLFGTRNPDRNPDQVAELLIGSAAQFLALWPNNALNEVYFLAYSDHDRELCQRAFYRLRLAEPTAQTAARTDQEDSDDDGGSGNDPSGTTVP